MYNVVQKLNLVVHLMHSYHTVFFKTVLIYLRVGLGYLKALRQNLNSRQNFCFRVFLGNANYVQVQSKCTMDPLQDLSMEYYEESLLGSTVGSSNQEPLKEMSRI